MSTIINWDSVSPDGWTYRKSERPDSKRLIYKITKLPVFTDYRFSYLSKENDERIAEVLKLQMDMLRRFHELGPDWAVSFRMLKRDRITIYLIFRYAGLERMDERMLQSKESYILNSLMHKEYTFQKVEDIEEEREILDLSWAESAAEITKKESEYFGDEYPAEAGGGHRSFYVPYRWNPNGNNTMEAICNALIRHQGIACIEVTVVSAKYLDEEKSWMNRQIDGLRECMNGETYRSEKNGKIIWSGKKLPTLKTPLENCEKMNKQFDTGRVFLSSIHIFADQNTETLAQDFLTNSSNGEGTIRNLKKGFNGFTHIQNTFEEIDLSVEDQTPYWKTHNFEELPFRAQRLGHLCSVEEISCFFRLPMPVRSGFAGFDLDTGLKDFSQKKEQKSTILLGHYLDDALADQAEASFDSQQMAKHGLIVGVPGSGKTTAMFNILYQLWAVPDEQKIPFIILEPAKTEYRALKSLPEFKEDLLVFTLGDEGTSPFRFNPMEVLPGIKIESHISRLLACFTGAFDLFDPLPMFLEQAVRRTYEEKGWYDDSAGGEEGLEVPTLSDLCRNAEYIVAHSKFDDRMRSDFEASLLERLNSLRRGSKGRMLDTKQSIPMEELMGKPVVLELDSLNGDEKSLMMMFILSYVFEYCKAERKSGSSLKHMLIVEEAHNLIGASGGQGRDNRADPSKHTIELFTNMLAEMRALGEGILIADQLPTAIAPQAVKQTNLKILMRMTAKDDREEIGNTMDLDEEQMHQVINFKTGHAYIYHEGEDRVRLVRMQNFKGEHDVEEPQSDSQLKEEMSSFEKDHADLYIPYEECSQFCQKCDRRVRNQAERFIHELLLEDGADPGRYVFPNDNSMASKSWRLCAIGKVAAKRKAAQLKKRYHHLGESFGHCVYVHILNKAAEQMKKCKNECLYSKSENICSCSQTNREHFLEEYHLIMEGNES